jgi:hypothetical protein
MHEFDAADLDDPVSFGQFEAGGFGIKDDLTHGAEGYQLAHFVDAAIR